MQKVAWSALVSLVRPFPMLSLHTSVSFNIRGTADHHDQHGIFTCDLISNHKRTPDHPQ
jgi:hypothetical protein